jgi:hypothetical protein
MSGFLATHYNSWIDPKIYVLAEKALQVVTVVVYSYLHKLLSLSLNFT